MKKIITMTALATIIASPIAFAQETNISVNDMNNPSNVHMERANNVRHTDNTPSNAQVEADQDKWWHDRDINNDGRISKDEYVKSETRDGDKTIEEATREFEERDDDNDGYIDASEFKAWFERVGDRVSGN